jgi:hypothetical protein
MKSALIRKATDKQPEKGSRLFFSLAFALFGFSVLIRGSQKF